MGPQGEFLQGHFTVSETVFQVTSAYPVASIGVHSACQKHGMMYSQLMRERESFNCKIPLTRFGGTHTKH
jgi:hypothetical protein